MLTIHRSFERLETVPIFHPTDKVSNFGHGVFPVSKGLPYTNSYSLSQNYSAVPIVATLSYNIPISEVETLFLCADLASFVIATNEMVQV